MARNSMITKKISYAVRSSFLVLILFSQSCGVYSLGGINIPAGMKTVWVDVFVNNAPLVVATLSNRFTEALKTRIRDQSPLSLLKNSPQATFEGTITDYSITPTAIQGNDRAGLLRMTITVNIKYTNTLKQEDGFEQSFTRYTDFKPPVQSQELQRIEEVNKMLTEDIFNRAFANW